MGFPGGTEVKNLPASAGGADSISGSGRSLGEGNGNPLQYSCLGNPMDRGTWWATVHSVPKSHTGLSMYTHRWCPGICGDSPEDMTLPAIWVLLPVDLF